MQYVYLLREGDNYYKVGISANVRSRVSGLQHHIPNKIEIVCTKFLDTSAYDAEQELHRYLERYKTDGANEWFKLTPEKALELCIRINNYPDIDISERVTLATIANNVRRNQRLIERKLDLIVNTYQKHLRDTVKVEQVPIASIMPEAVEDTKFAKQREDQYLYKRAEDFVKRAGYASTSSLQRELRVGYGRAARIIDQLEQARIIGPHDGSLRRSVLVGEGG